MEIPPLPLLRSLHAEASLATLTACLKKVQRMARDTRTLRASALAKIDEFKRLDYPQTLLRKACTFLAASSGESTWISVRNQV